jgi:hypothetical protein
MENVIQSMKKAGINRIINLSSATTSFKGESINFSRKIFRTIFNMIAPVMIPGKEKELEVLMSSDINWTNIRPPAITNKVKGKLRASEIKTLGMKVNTGQLINFMLDNIHSDEWSKKAPFVGTK